jgi:hypothetical protein
VHANGRPLTLVVTKKGLPQISPFSTLRREPLSTARAAFHADLIIGPGQIVRDNMGIWFLIALTALILVSRCSGGRCHVVAISVGKMLARLHILLWKIIILSSSQVSFRDSTSMKRGEGIFGPNRRFKRTSDLAFLETPLLRPLRDPHSLTGAHSPFVIVAPCCDPDEGRILTAGPAVAIALAAARAAKCDRILFVAHDIRDGADKKLATDCNRILAEVHCAGQVNASVLATDSIDALLNAYAMARLVATNRLHSALLGMLAGRPVFSISDGSGKLDSHSGECHFRRFVMRIYCSLT